MSASVSAHRQVADDLAGRIAVGEFRSGKLPTLPELCDYYDYGQTTIQRALEVLKDRGLIEYRPGRGHWIRLT
jgi:DNA-binding GntR family transcriptional regulator